MAATEPFFYRIGDDEMRRVTLIRFYILGHLHRLREIHLKDLPERAFGNMTRGRLVLQDLIENDEFQRMVPNAVERAKDFDASLAEAIKTILPNGAVVSKAVVDEIESRFTIFEASLQDDLRRLPIYYVEKVGAYSTDDLLSTAEAVFPVDIMLELPQQAIEDFRMAGKCLAFDAPTACGFHAFRATDAMLRTYCDHFGAIPKGQGRDWFKFITALRELSPTAAKKPNNRTIELLDSIRAMDRNPVVHPDQNLDHDGALLMFDLCKNAISLMAVDIRNAP